MNPQPSVSPTEQAWDEAASGYDAYFVPRFAAYMGAAIGALIARSAELPSGDIMVPCAGPGRELGPLARAFPERAILASDLSSEMVALARARNAPHANVSVEQADATALSKPSGDVAALLSIFGLQLLPNPAAALASWLRLLAPGGVAVILYWPRLTEHSGPFHSMQQLLRNVGMRDGQWEGEFEAHVSQAGGRLLADARLGFPMQHDDARTVWEAFTSLGPLRALALTRGQAVLDALGAEFVAGLPEGRLDHVPEARLLVIARR